MTEISIGEKEKRTNKGTDKQYVAVFCYTIQLITIKLCTKFQNPNLSSCREIDDGKKVYKQTNKQTNIITEKAKTIYPLLDGWLRMGLLPLIGNFADISYLVKN